MTDWLIRIAFFGIALLVAVLLVTSLPEWRAEHMSGQWLIVHMMAGGALVVATPLFGLIFLRRAISPLRSSWLQRCGFWLLLISAVLTISSVLLCMIPLLTTEQMRSWMTFHGYAGLAMVPALALLAIGGLRWRRIQSMRSATPG